MPRNIDRWPGSDRREARIIDQLREAAMRNQYRVLDYSVNQAGVTAGVETTLFQTTIPANTFSRNGDSISFAGAVNYAATASNKQVRLYFGGVNMYDTGSLAITTAEHMEFSGVMVRYGISQYKFTLQLTGSVAALQGVGSYGTNNANSQVDNILKLTANGAFASDINGFIWHVAYLPTSTPNG